MITLWVVTRRSSRCQYLHMFIMYVCVYMSVCVCARAQVCKLTFMFRYACPCMDVQRSELNVGCVGLSFSTLFLEAKSLAEAGAHQLARRAQWVISIPQLPLPSAGVTGTCCYAWLFTQVLGLKLRSLHLCSKYFTKLTHLPGLLNINIFTKFPRWNWDWKSGYRSVSCRYMVLSYPEEKNVL